MAKGVTRPKEEVGGWRQRLSGHQWAVEEAARFREGVTESVWRSKWIENLREVVARFVEEVVALPREGEAGWE